VAAILLVVGLIGLLANQPILFASLGPTLYLQASDSKLASARLYNVVLSHAIGLLAAYLALLIVGADHAPSIFETHQLNFIRIVAAALAIFLAIPVEIMLGASHPPAAATTLLVTLGAFHINLSDALTAMTCTESASLLGISIKLVKRHHFHEVIPRNTYAVSLQGYAGETRGNGGSHVAQ